MSARAAAINAIRDLASADGNLSADETVRLYLHAYYLGAAHAMEQTIAASPEARRHVIAELHRQAEAELDVDEGAR